MYDRHIEKKKNMVFVTENEYVVMELPLLPEDVAFYCEYEGDWWIERKPFAGQEKNEDVRHICLQYLKQAEELIAQRREEVLEDKPISSDLEIVFLVK